MFAKILYWTVLFLIARNLWRVLKGFLALKGQNQMSENSKKRKKKHDETIIEAEYTVVKDS